MRAVAIDWDANAIGEGHDFVRFALLSGFLQKYSRGGSVLDVGCDTGKLSEGLGNMYYTGIDARIQAIENAKRLFPHSTFICARAEEWIPDQTFDAIVFNESLYYLHDFVAVLKKFHDYLRPGGLLLISIYKQSRWFGPNYKALKVSRRLVDGPYNKIHDITVTSDKLSWNILIARKHPSAAYILSH
jgi:trans-aconitate methyltransferase